VPPPASPQKIAASPEARAAPTTDALDAGDREIVDDEVGMSARVGRRIAKSISERQNAAKIAPQRGELDGELVSLRDQIGEARNEDVPALLAEMMRVAAVQQLGGPKAEGLVDPNVPYFGHLRLEEEGRRRDVLVGKRAMVDRAAGVVIVDWRNAPVSRLYYRYDEGDEYEEELGEVVREGEVLVRRTVSFTRGQLTRVACPGGTFIVKNPGEGGGEWVALPRVEAPELAGGVGKAARAPAARGPRRPTRGKRQGRARLGHEGEDHLRPDKHLPEIAALIDRAQFEAMTQPDAGVVVLQGGAGSGKTTVALHRIAWLAFQNRKRFAPKKMMVVVNQPALVRFVERVLPSLDVEGVRVQAYADWARWAMKRVVPSLRRRVVDEAPAEVGQVKKHPGMLRAIREQIARREREIAEALERALDGADGRGRVLADWRARTPVPIVPRIEEFVEGLQYVAAPDDTRERARRAVEPVLRKLCHLLEEWEELVTDRGLLERCLDDVPPRVLDEALRWTSRQIDEPDDEDVDASAKKPIDDRGPDEDDPLRSLDAHDPTLFLNLWIERTGGLYMAANGPSTSGRPIRYEHIAVDEAQDLSAVEIRPLLVATGKARSLTLAGDVVQKVVFDNGFSDWNTLIDQLETTAFEVEPFRLTYRSTEEVVQFARDVLGPLAPAEPPAAVRHGAPVEAFAFDDPGQEIAFLAESLRSVMAREPNASVAVLLRYPERAQFYAKMLDDAEVPRLRLIDGADSLTFSPGVDVTHIAQIKGLEYDYVVLAEMTAASYPDEVAARHLLHIGATRAAHQLWVTTARGSPSPLLPHELLEEG
jgi:DNA helicase-2/ATP-dependent DNA helicase PcrA